MAALPPASVTLVVLSRPEFESAVQNALRHFTRPDQLADNPLLNSRLVADEGGLQQSEAERVEHLRRRISSAAELLQQSARDAKLYRALDRTYFRPTPTQEAAARSWTCPSAPIAATCGRVLLILSTCCGNGNWAAANPEPAWDL